MKRPDSPNLLPLEVEEQLSHLLERWANDNRLPAARARSIREGVQERDGWNQKFWTRMSPVLMCAAAVVRPVPSKPWGLALPLFADHKEGNHNERTSSTHLASRADPLLSRAHYC